jgi:septal ring factor EnvC (AmiA/AmiB activator)
LSGPVEKEEKEAEIKKLEADLMREREQYLRYGSEEENLLDQLALLEKGIGDQRNLIAELRENIRYQKKELKEYQRRQAETDRSVKNMEERLTKRLVALYKYARRGTLRLLGTSVSPIELRKRIKYLGAINGEDQRLFRDMNALRRRHEQELLKAEEKLSTISELEEMEARRLQTIKEDLDRKVILLMKIHEEKEFYETAVRELESAAQNMKETLVALEGWDVSQKNSPPSGFDHAKGKLPAPMDGKIVIPSRRLGKKSVVPKGVYFEGPPEEEVRAVYPGRVEYSGMVKGYGQVIVINHGSRYFTIFGQLSKRDLIEGETVASGEVIGRAGGAVAFGRARLYFEIRRGSESLDPTQWLERH